ncbi:MAG: efflux RND transporter periplasmic adaptor subunit [Marinobacter sp.]|uniref:efflux RND transporter periplasmic adaptor subunit n=1 Tax=Marinobacter sp. TaxID=50741 RepID=UPI001B6D60C7|nr:efflux RND transporter periplasmic adaptor subunit [Marinobacter sp.]MBQ0746466.1 efflux RND transporter periplasmic adaptor subunit [Marinobacter sp.]MBQ0813990.1 efflux RND transporter periplasmic adaptor subunit [Marinobacter sp.]|tara:strand:- start:19034 stop:20257 length:1224 start_codon:yes stop_codon:yes gene_type:complete
MLQITRRLPLALLLAALFVSGAPLAQEGDAGEHEGESHQDDGKQGHEEEREEKHNEEEGAVHLTEAQQSLLNIAVSPAASGRANENIRAPVEIIFVPDLVAKVGPLLEAKVSKVLVDLGDRISTGDTLATLDSVMLARVRARMQSLTAKKTAAEAEYKRERSLQKQGISSEEEFLAAKARFLTMAAELNAAREELKAYGVSSSQSDASGLASYALKSPINGVLEKRDVVIGQTLSASDTPFLVVNNRKVWAMIKVAESDIDQLTLGNDVRIQLPSGKPRVYVGKVSWISTQLDETSRTVLVRAEVDTPEGYLRPGMFGTALVSSPSDAALPLVPRDAVQTVEGRDVVFVPGAERGEYQATPVKIGAEANGWIEIQEGIRSGQVVVANGAFDLMSALTAKNRSASHGH